MQKTIGSVLCILIPLNVKTKIKLKRTYKLQGTLRKICNNINYKRALIVLMF